MLVKCPHYQKFNRLSLDRLNEKSVCGACKESLLTSPIDADQVSFQEILKACKMSVIVDFLALWCRPCKMFAPTFAASAKINGAKLLYVKLDTDANPSIGQKFNIRSIQTLAIFKHGVEVERISGHCLQHS